MASNIVQFVVDVDTKKSETNLENLAVFAGQVRDAIRKLENVKVDSAALKKLNAEFKASAGDINSVDAALERLNTTFDEVKVKVQQASQAVSQGLNRSENINALIGQVDQLRAAINSLGNVQGLDTLSRDVTKLQTKLRSAGEGANIGQLEAQVSKVTTQFDLLNTKLSQTVSRLDFRDVTTPAINSLDRLRSALGTLKEQLNTTAEQGTPRYRKLASVIGELQREIKQAEIEAKKFGAAAGSIERVSATLQGLRNQAQNLNVASNEFRSLNQLVGIFNRRLQEAKDQANVFQQISGTLNKFKAELRQANNVLANTREGSQAFNEAAEAAGLAQRNIQRLRNSINELGQVQGSLGQLEATLRRLRNELKFADSTDEVSRLNREIRDTQQSIKAFGNEEGSVNQLRAAIASVNAELKTLSGSTPESAQRINELTTELEGLENQLEDVRRRTSVTRQEVQQFDNTLAGLDAQIAELNNQKLNLGGSPGDVKKLQEINNQLDGLVRRRNSLQRSQISSANTLANVEARLQAVNAELRNTEVGSSVYRRLQKEAAEYEAQLTRIRNKTRQVGTATQGLSARLTDLARNFVFAFGVGFLLNEVREQLSEIVRVGREFGAQISAVRAITGATNEEFERLVNLARQLGRETTFTATEAAEAAETLAVAGFSIEEIIQSQRGVLELAQAGGVSLANAADIAASTLRGFGLQATEITRVNEILTNSFTNFNLQLNDFFEASKLFTPVARSVGLELEESAGLINALANAGFRGSIAGTALRALVVNLSKPSDKAKKALEGLGIQLTENNGDLRNLIDLLGEFEAKNLSSTVASRIFGKQVTAFNILTSTGAETLKDYAAQVGELGTLQRAIAQEFQGGAVTIRTFREALGQVKPTIEEIRVTFNDFSESSKAVNDELERQQESILATQQALDVADITYSESAAILGVVSEQVIQTTRDLNGLTESASVISKQEIVQDQTVRGFQDFVQFLGSREVEDAFGNFLDPITGARLELNQIVAELDNIATEDLNAAITSFIAPDQTQITQQIQQRIDTLIGTFQRLRDDNSFDQVAVQLANFSNTAQIAAERINNLDGDLRILNSAKEDLFINLFSQVEPAFRDFAQTLTENIQTVSETLEATGDLSDAFAELGLGGRILGELIEFIIDNGESLLILLGAIVPAAFALSRAFAFGTSILRSYSVAAATASTATTGLTGVTLRMTKVARGLFAVLRANPFFAITAAISGVVVVFNELTEAIEGSETALDRINDISFEVIARQRQARAEISLFTRSLTEAAATGLDSFQKEFNRFVKEFGKEIEDAQLSQTVATIQSRFKDDLTVNLNTVLAIVEQVKAAAVAGIALTDEQERTLENQERSNELAAQANKVTETRQRIQSALNDLVEREIISKERLNELLLEEEGFITSNNKSRLEGAKESENAIEELGKEIGRTTSKATELANEIIGGGDGGFFTSGVVRQLARALTLSDAQIEALSDVVNQQNAENISVISAIAQDSEEEINAFGANLLNAENIRNNTKKFLKDFEKAIPEAVQQLGITGAQQELGDILKLADEVNLNVLSTLEGLSEAGASQQREILAELRTDLEGFVEQARKTEEEINKRRLDVTKESATFVRELGSVFSEPLDLAGKTAEQANEVVADFIRNLPPAAAELFEKTGEISQERYEQLLINLVPDPQIRERFRDKFLSLIDLNIKDFKSAQDKVFAIEQELNDNRVAFVNKLQATIDRINDRDGLNLKLGDITTDLSQEQLDSAFKLLQDLDKQGRKQNEDAKKRNEEFADRLATLAIQANKSLETQRRLSLQYIDDIEEINRNELISRREFARLSTEQQIALLQDIEREFQNQRAQLVQEEIDTIVRLSEQRRLERDNQFAADRLQSVVQFSKEQQLLRRQLDERLITQEEFLAAQEELLNRQSTSGQQSDSDEAFGNVNTAGLLANQERQLIGANERVLELLAEQRDERLRGVEAGSKEEAKIIREYQADRLIQERRFQTELADLRNEGRDAELDVTGTLSNLDELLDQQLSALQTRLRNTEALQESITKSSNKTDAATKKSLEIQLKSEQEFQKNYDNEIRKALEQVEQVRFAVRAGLNQSVASGFVEDIRAINVELLEARAAQTKRLKELQESSESVSGLIKKSERELIAKENERILALETQKVEETKKLFDQVAALQINSNDTLELFLEEQQRLYINGNREIAKLLEDNLITQAEANTRSLAELTNYIDGITTIIDRAAENGLGTDLLDQLRIDEGELDQTATLEYIGKRAREVERTSEDAIETLKKERQTRREIILASVDDEKERNRQLASLDQEFFRERDKIAKSQVAELRKVNDLRGLLRAQDLRDQTKALQTQLESNLRLQELFKDSEVEADKQRLEELQKQERNIRTQIFDEVSQFRQDNDEAQQSFNKKFLDDDALFQQNLLDQVEFYAAQAKEARANALFAEDDTARENFLNQARSFEQRATDIVVTQTQKRLKIREDAINKQQELFEKSIEAEARKREVADDNALFRARNVGELQSRLAEQFSRESEARRLEDERKILLERQRNTQSLLNELTKQVSAIQAVNELFINSNLPPLIPPQAVKQTQDRIKQLTKDMEQLTVDLELNEKASIENTERARLERLERIRGDIEQISQAVGQVITEYTDLEIQQSEKRIAQIEKEYARRLELLDIESERRQEAIAQIQSPEEIIAERQKLNTIEGIREELSNRETARREKEAKELEERRDRQVAEEEARIERITRIQRAAAAVQTAINIAVGVSRLFAETGVGAAVAIPILLAAVAAGIGAARSLAAPVQTFEDGGTVPEFADGGTVGMRHHKRKKKRKYADGGTITERSSFSQVASGGDIGGKPHSQGGTVIEAQKGEKITNVEGSQLFGPAIDFANEQGLLKRKGLPYETSIPQAFTQATVKTVSTRQPRVIRRFGKAQDGGTVAGFGRDDRTVTITKTKEDRERENRLLEVLENIEVMTQTPPRVVLVGQDVVDFLDSTDQRTNIIEQ